MPLIDQDVPTDLRGLRTYLKSVVESINRTVNKSVSTIYGGLRTSEQVTDAIGTAFATVTQYDTVMPDGAGPYGVLADAAAGTLRVKTSGIYEVIFSGIGIGNVSGIDFQLIKNGVLFATIPMQNMAVVPSPKFVASLAEMMQLEKGDTLAVQWKSTSSGIAHIEATFSVKRISEAFD